MHQSEALRIMINTDGHVLLYFFQDDSENSNIGEILVSLCYLPTAGRLTLVVLKSRLFQANNGLPSKLLHASYIILIKEFT